MAVPVASIRSSEAAAHDASRDGTTRSSSATSSTQLPYLVGGALVTLQIAIVLVLRAGTSSALPAHRARLRRRALARRVVSGYVTSSRIRRHWCRFPALLRLPDRRCAAGPMTAVLIGLTLNSGATDGDPSRRRDLGAPLGDGGGDHARACRAADPALRDAAHIASTIYAPLSNFFVLLVLGSSLAALFGVEELTGRAINISTGQSAHDRDVQHRRAASTSALTLVRAAPHWHWSDAGRSASRRRIF